MTPEESRALAAVTEITNQDRPQLIVKTSQVDRNSLLDAVRSAIHAVRGERGGLLERPHGVIRDCRFRDRRRFFMVDDTTLTQKPGSHPLGTGAGAAGGAATGAVLGAVVAGPIGAAVGAAVGGVAGAAAGHKAWHEAWRPRTW